MEKPKIFGVGFQKTGTSSLQRAFEILGYKSCGARPDLLLDILNGRYKKVTKIVNKYEVFLDHPWPQIFDFLDEHYPGSKFILTIREEEDWFKSVSNHVGDFRSPIHEWIYGKGYGLPKYNKKHTIEVYKKHQQKVIQYFSERPNSLLIIDFQHDFNWKTLCEFLNVQIPDVPFPHLNKTNYNARSDHKDRLGKIKYYRKRIKNKILLAYINWKKLN
ncbi:MAG: hypothetical protein IIA45_00880 [Bacteroidetes bacterium]|nr:hypothetical protein [Bacteroidota bacterium]